MTDSAIAADRREPFLPNERLTASVKKALPLVGLSFWQAWWMILSTTSFICGPVRTLDSIMGLVLVTTLAGYVVLTLLATRKAPYSRKSSFAVAALGCFAGSLLLGFATHVDLPAELGAALEIGGACVMAPSNALLLLMWGERWSTLTAGDVGNQLCISFAFAFVWYFCVLFLPVPLAVVLTSLLAPFSTLALAVSQRLPCRTEPVAPVSLKARPTAGILVCILIFSFAFGCLQRCAYSQSDHPNLRVLSMVVTGVFIALFALAMRMRHTSGDPFSFYRPIVPAIVCGMLVCLMTSPDRVFLGNGVLVAGIYCLDMFMMFASSDLAYRTKLPVALVFGTAIVVARAGTSAGTQFGTWVASPACPLGDNAISLVVLALACIVVIAGTVVFTETDLRAIYQPDAKPHVPNLDERCDQIGKSAGLSARELDVMRLLARGRSVAVISEALGIAQGTVKHHASNTYRKLGVYDRQGLIDIVAGNADDSE